ncbi:MAG: hypothetical protein A2905_05585 [Candidatus Levybacteria bacterium RIFCSPLOWO2_01_FULL_36_10]|nr:MAG: hypothetical protein A2905_05585 [Candidatus Levybacteria bacterium RIFCSPLOWO2_01_FULL_36_10]
MKKNINSRIFTALLPKHFREIRIRQFLISLEKPFSSLKKPLKISILVISFFLFIFLTLSSYSLLRIYSDVREKREERENHAFAWENILKRHPEYPDGYYVLAWDLYTLGDKRSAVFLLDKALLLDPNFKQAKELRDELTGKK